MTTGLIMILINVFINTSTGGSFDDDILVVSKLLFEGNNMHVLCFPRLMTSMWRKQLPKVADLIVNLSFNKRLLYHIYPYIHLQYQNNTTKYQRVFIV